MAILNGAFTVIVGPNACVKSTWPRALCRLLKPSAGDVFLDGKSINSFATKALARELACCANRDCAGQHHRGGPSVARA